MPVDLAMSPATYVMSLDYDSSNNLLYLGRALLGSAKSAAAWQIRKLFYDASNNLIDVKYSNGVRTYDAIWDNRASLSYS